MTQSNSSVEAVAARLAAEILAAVRSAKIPKVYAAEELDEFEALTLTPMLVAALAALPLPDKGVEDVSTGETRMITNDDKVEAVAELQLAAFLAGRGSVTSVKHGTRTAKPAPTMDEFRSLARQALTHFERDTPTADKGVLNCDGLAISMGREVTITFAEPDDAFSLFEELKARSIRALQDSE